MNKPLLTLLLLLFFIAAKAQTKNTDVPAPAQIDIKEPADTTDPKKIFLAVEKEPSFYAGNDRFPLYLAHQIVYPPDAVKKRIEGKVFVSFVVEKNGSLTDIQVLRGVSPDIDAEAVRAISKSPKWAPGIQNGRPVRVRYNMAIIFKLPPLQANKNQQMMDSLRQLPIEQTIFTMSQNMPEFPGGKEGFRKYFLDNLKYPDKAKEDNVDGKVLLNFIIERDGSLSNIKIIRHLSSETDEEALRVMNNCPKWIPGNQNGKPVRVAYSLSIPFPIKN
jgi:TonB family protein